MPEQHDFSRAYTRYLPPIRAKCRRLLGGGGAAEDVVQETFVRFWKSELSRAGTEADPRTIMAWLYRTCTRLAIDALRDRRRTEALLAVDEAPCGCDLAASAAAKRAIATLASTASASELEVVVLCRIDGLSQPEAAAVLGISDRTVRRMLERFDERTGPLRKELSS